ncbi:MAG: type I-B CRISPR-associated protein Cas8b1/Cst1 [Candidatus Aenigmatarchaeota archaeon]
MCQKIHLYPSNWLYNAGVVGFLRVLEKLGERVEDFLKDDGSAEIDRNGNLTTEEIFNIWDRMTKENKYIWGGIAGYYANQTENSIKKRIENLIRGYSTSSKKTNKISCFFCGDIVSISKSKASFYSQAYGNLLISSERTFKNSYWRFRSTDFVCPKCEFIVMCHHLGLTKLLDDSEIFINAPSFKLMWYLNKYSSIFKATTIGQYKEILGMSLIEMASKFYIQLGRWEKMNIEIVSKHGNKIDFFSFPAEIVDLLTNKEIASLLTQIGEFKILNMVIDGKFKDILSFAEKVMRITLKKSDERTENEKDFIRENIKLERNKKNLTEFSQKLFKLYALIEREIKRG